MKGLLHMRNTSTKEYIMKKVCAVFAVALSLMVPAGAANAVGWIGTPPPHHLILH